MSEIPALAAAMAAILLQLRPGETAPSERESDELRTWLIAASLALLAR